MHFAIVYNTFLNFISITFIDKISQHFHHTRWRKVSLNAEVLQNYFIETLITILKHKPGTIAQQQKIGRILKIETVIITTHVSQFTQLNTEELLIITLLNFYTLKPLATPLAVNIMFGLSAVTVLQHLERGEQWCQVDPAHSRTLFIQVSFRN